jgi:transcription antitermination factor NusG
MLAEATNSTGKVQSDSRHWYAVYTAPRHEKTVAEQLHFRSIEHYLPLCETTHYWNKRRAIVQLPIFPNYVFVQVSPREHIKVLTIPSVVRIVGFNGRYVPLPDEEIASLRRCLSVRAAEPYPYLQSGDRVRIRSGPLQGMEGIVLHRKDKLTFVVSIDLMMRSVAVHIHPHDLAAMA